MSVVLILMLLLSFSYVSRERAKKIYSKLGVGDISTYTREVTSRLTFRERFLIYCAFIAAFTLEVLSLRVCFMSLDMAISGFNVLALFAILYFLSKLPFLPQGVILVETVGFIVLINLNYNIQQTGAVLILWDVVRLAAPVMLSAGFSLALQRK